nr:hypothetical protein CFP56_01752 [Quercus suber]
MGPNKIRGIQAGAPKASGNSKTSKIYKNCGCTVLLSAGSTIIKQIMESAIEIPRWFKFNHHQSVGDSVSFLVGPKFSNLVVCIAFPSKDENSNMENHCFIDISINGVKQPFIDFVNYDHVWLIYGKVNISNPSEENRIKVEFRQMVQMRSKNTMRIYVECICCPASSMDQWAFNNGEEDSGHVGIRHRLQRRNHRPTHARHPQKHYLSRFGWLRIRFQLWKRSSKPWRR